MGAGTIESFTLYEYDIDLTLPAIALAVAIVGLITYVVVRRRRE